ncbi:MAG: acyl carrier protein [Bacilli bacterium]|nr:acyl carrier protein [Bacilli bacterium]
MNEKMNEIKALFAEKLGMSKVDESKLLRDLGLDSLDIVELCMELEDRYGIAFETDKLSDIKTVSDLYAEIERKLAEKAA